MTFEPGKYINDSIKAVQPSGIRKFFDLCAGSKDIISLGVGEPDFVSPWTIREACVYSLEKGYTMYTSNYGLPELRHEIVKYMDERGTSVTANRILSDAGKKRGKQRARVDAVAAAIILQSYLDSRPR